MILFVCTGNTCRSPMAKAILEHNLKTKGVNMPVLSRGVFATESAPTQGAISALATMGLELNGHVPTTITTEDVLNASLVLTMSWAHKNLVANLIGTTENIYTFYEYINGAQQDITDPYGGSIEIYLQTAKEISKLVEELTHKLTEEEV